MSLIALYPSVDMEDFARNAASTYLKKIELVLYADKKLNTCLLSNKDQTIPSQLKKK